jgi:hypothetical protein
MPLSMKLKIIWNRVWRKLDLRIALPLSLKCCLSFSLSLSLFLSLLTFTTEETACRRDRLPQSTSLACEVAALGLPIGHALMCLEEDTPTPKFIISQGWHLTSHDTCTTTKTPAYEIQLSKFQGTLLEHEEQEPLEPRVTCINMFGGQN